MFSRTCKLTNCKCNMRLVLTNLHQTLPKHGLIPNISVTCNLNVSRIFVGVLNNSHFAWGVSPSNAVFTVVIGFIRNCYELLFFACQKSPSLWLFSLYVRNLSCFSFVVESNIFMSSTQFRFINSWKILEQTSVFYCLCYVVLLIHVWQNKTFSKDTRWQVDNT